MPAALDDTGRIRGVRVGSPPYPEAFLSQSLARVIDPAVVSLAPEALAELLGPRVAPVVLVGHTGRSGSTLLCRLVDASGHLASFREPPGLLDALDPGRRNASSEAVAAVVAWMSESARVVGRAAVIKLPSHDAAHVATLRLPPGSRRGGIVRHPVDVAKRMLNDPPGWLIDRAVAAGAARPPTASGEPLDLNDDIAALVGRGWADAAVSLAADAVDTLISYRALLDDPIAAVAELAGPRAADGLAASGSAERILAHDAKSSVPFRAGRPPLPEGLVDAVLCEAQPGLAALRARGLDLDPDDL